MPSSPAATIIFSTYNQPEWLRKTLLGFAAQDRTDFEVVVADDGSRDDTRALIDTLRSRLPYELQHVWQPDDGFRKCEILNAAIRASRADYLVFTDGDCIPRGDFVASHLRLRQPGRFLSGGYFKLPMATSTAIQPDDIASGRCFELAWLRRHGVPFQARNLKLWARDGIATVLDRMSTARPSWNGHNSSGWKADLVKVNGFDERMGYGGEDRDIGERLENIGVRGLRIRYRAIALHLDHPRGYADPAARELNERILAETCGKRLGWTEHGLQRREG